jgi:hypothetical protein
MKAAREANSQLQNAYIMNITQYKRRSLVFIDESAFDRRVSIRKRAWAKVGHRVIESVPFLRGRRLVHDLDYYLQTYCGSQVLSPPGNVDEWNPPCQDPRRLI